MSKEENVNTVDGKLEDTIIFHRYDNKNKLEETLSLFNKGKQVSLAKEELEVDEGMKVDDSFLGNFGGFDVTIWYVETKHQELLITGVSFDEYDEDDE